MQRITSMKLLDKRKQAFMIELDGEIWRDIDVEVIAKFRLAENDELSPARKTEIEQENDYVLMRRKTVNFCVKQPRTHREVMRLLMRKRIKPEIAERIFRELRRQHLLRDRDVAKKGVRKAERSKLGPMRMQAELQQRGVPREVIDEEINVIRDHEWQLNQAEELARKRLLRLEKLEPAARKRRVMDYLLRRGFESEVVQEIIEKLE